MQEIKLLEGAYDGDIEGVRSVLSTGVPVDATYPVRFVKIITLGTYALRGCSSWVC